MYKTTEAESHYNHLEKMSVYDLLVNMNTEDKSVPQAIEKCIPQIEKCIPVIVEKIKSGGRLFYIGAGTSGRLGVLDASECPPTFGVENNLVIGIIAGGDIALKQAVEFAEDNEMQAIEDLKNFNLNSKDFLIGITASGTTPYVLSAVNYCKSNEILTAGISCNENSALSNLVDFPIECVVGPEFLTGSTRLKAGTAVKLILNMISTSVMIGLGRVVDNKMVDMKINNSKLQKRAVRMIIQALNVDENQAVELLEKYGNVRKAIKNEQK